MGTLRAGCDQIFYLLLDAIKNPEGFLAPGGMNYLFVFDNCQALVPTPNPNPKWDWGCQ